MKTNVGCLQCCFANFLGIMDQFKIEQDSQEEQAREFLTFLANLDYNCTPAEIVRAAHIKIKDLVNSEDPYYDKKKLYNQKMLEQYSHFYNQVIKSANPVKKAVTLAIGGNLIDFLPKNNTNFDEKIQSIFQKELVIDNYDQLIDDLQKANSILYLTDNTGEIVLDKLLIQTLIENNIIAQTNITVATRGWPIINDATFADAEDIGLTDLVRVIHNGDNNPGTILRTSSAEFREVFQNADVIISKGQGNYETLDSVEGKNIYFLFVAKCSYVADLLGVSVDDFICLRQ